MEECYEQLDTDPTIQKECTNRENNGIKTILLTKEDNERLYSPWKYSLIIKLFGKRIVHQYLRAKL